ncbi:unnamed protein product [Rotaria magnacalcarata]|uniref:Uncharacterized protein n=1 Tax=Rotaria magnacalcarata TaxID=392030 RepID=A0A816WLQ1_9BILA|nr:unnamed protein product [Rotaria magnacalcarata]
MRSAVSVLASNDADIFMLGSFSDVDSEDSNIVLDGNFRQITNELFILRLSYGRFSAARLHARRYSADSRVEETTKFTQRFDDHQVAHFVNFIVSPQVRTDLPFGKKLLKLSSGIELFVLNTIRNMGATRIIEQYLLYCKEMCSDFEPIEKSINHFAPEAGEAFDVLQKMLEDKVALCSNSERLIVNLKRVRFYFKSDYKVHVERSSNTADQCYIYALSYPKQHDFEQGYDHEHNESCIECSNSTSTLNEIERFIEEKEKEEGLFDQALKRFRSYRGSIKARKVHLLRFVNQDLCRKK